MTKLKEEIKQRVGELTFANLPNVFRMIQKERGLENITFQVAELMYKGKKNIDEALQYLDNYYQMGTL